LARPDGAVAPSNASALSAATDEVTRPETERAAQDTMVTGVVETPTSAPLHEAQPEPEAGLSSAAAAATARVEVATNTPSRSEDRVVAGEAPAPADPLLSYRVAEPVEIAPRGAASAAVSGAGAQSSEDVRGVLDRMARDISLPLPSDVRSDVHASEAAPQPPSVSPLAESDTQPLADLSVDDGLLPPAATQRDVETPPPSLALPDASSALPAAPAVPAARAVPPPPPPPVTIETPALPPAPSEFVDEGEMAERLAAAQAAILASLEDQAEAGLDAATSAFVSDEDLPEALASSGLAPTAGSVAAPAAIEVAPVGEGDPEPTGIYMPGAPLGAEERGVAVSADPPVHRSSVDRPDAADQTPASPVPFAELGGEQQLAAITGALAKERIDVLLEPIKPLETNAAGHFEVRLRLQVEGEASIDCDVFGDTVAGTPLLPLIDAISVAKSRQVSRRLSDTGNASRVFTAVSGASVREPQFNEDCQTITSGDPKAASRMILSFPQSDARHFSDAEIAALTRLNAQGFSFAVDHLTDLDTDFDRLNEAGFQYVKIDAEVFLDGLQVGMTRVPADDICRHLGSLGLTPIVGTIRDVTQLQRLRACGVQLGQGPLLGAPRALTADWFRSPTTA
ncbi:MAG: EAL domain-containing protein, partial [Pseudomonadota bacterium]